MEEGKREADTEIQTGAGCNSAEADRGGGSDIELMPQMSFFLCGFYLGGVGEWAEAGARRPDVLRFPRERPQGD